MRSSLLVLTLTIGWLSVSGQDAGAQQGPLPWGPATANRASADSYSSFIGDLEEEDSGGYGSKGCDAKGCDGKGGLLGDCAKCRPGYLRATFASIEYLHWWNKGRHLPPLVTTSPAGTPQARVGVLGFDTTEVLYGDENIGGDLQVAGRLTVGMWLDETATVGVGVRVFGVEGHNSGFSRLSNGGNLAVPFFDADPLWNDENALQVGLWNNPFREGGVNIWAENEVFGSQVFLRHMLDQGRDYRLDLLLGYRFNRLNDDLAINLATGPFPAITFSDLFRTRNEYHAGEIGLIGEYQADRWTYSALGSISYGSMNQRVSISGESTVDGTPVYPGGLFAQPTNSGEYKRNLTAWCPEVGVKMAYAVTPRVSVSVGYTFLYWTRIALAGDQIDRTVNSTQLLGGVLAGPARPQYLATDTDFWVQTIDIGVSLNY